LLWPRGLKATTSSRRGLDLWLGSVTFGYGTEVDKAVAVVLQLLHFLYPSHTQLLQHLANHLDGAPFVQSVDAYLRFVTLSRLRRAIRLRQGLVGGRHSLKFWFFFKDKFRNSLLRLLC